MTVEPREYIALLRAINNVPMNSFREAMVDAGRAAVAGGSYGGYELIVLEPSAATLFDDISS